MRKLAALACVALIGAAPPPSAFARREAADDHRAGQRGADEADTSRTS